MAEKRSDVDDGARDTGAGTSAKLKGRVQANLDGYAEWVFHKLVEYRGESIGSVGTYVIQRWIDDNADYLARFNITRDGWELERKGGKVARFPPAEGK